MPARLPVSASPVAYQIASAYAGKILALFWPSGADAMHRLRAGETSTTIITRATSGATYNATDGLIEGTSTTRFSDGVSGGYGSLTEGSDFAAFAFYYGDVFNGANPPSGSAEDFQSIAANTFSESFRIQGLDYGITVGLKDGTFQTGTGAMDSATMEYGTIGFRTKQSGATAKQMVWVNGTENTAVRGNVTNSGSSLIGSDSRPLYFGRSMDSGANQKIFVEGYLIALATLADADMAAISGNPGVLVEAAAAPRVPFTRTRAMGPILVQ